MRNNNLLYENLMDRITPIIQSALAEAASANKKQEKVDLPFTPEEQQTREFKVSLGLFNELETHEKSVKEVIELMRILSPNGKERHNWVSYKKIIPYLRKFAKLTPTQKEELNK